MHGENWTIVTILGLLWGKGVLYEMECLRAPNIVTIFKKIARDKIVDTFAFICPYVKDI